MNKPLKITNNFIEKIEKIEKRDLSPSEFVKKWEITQEEFIKFGDRFPREFQRQKLLGRLTKLPFNI